MVSSSSSTARVNGTEILVNMYASKADPALVFADLQHGDPIQAYIVHSDKQGLGTDSIVWESLLY